MKDLGFESGSSTTDLQLKAPMPGRILEVLVASGDEVVILGPQGDDHISAAEWAEIFETITYEIICGIESRIPRRYS